MKAQVGPDTICHALTARKHARRLARLYDRHLAPTGLSISQFSILSRLRARKRIKIAELADILVMERTSLVRALKPLQTAGWVVAEASEQGRSLELVLSPSGLKKLSEALPLWQEAQVAFERAVGRERAVGLRKEIYELNQTA